MPKRQNNHRTRTTLRSAGTTGAAVMVLLAFAAALPGCYERVVKAKGLGADSVAVSEPYQESSKLDDWIFGKEEPKSKSLLNR